MIIKCGFCGKEIEVADSIVEGQHVRCPFCEGKFSYRKPTRIPLPTEIVASSDAPAKPVKPKIALIRPSSQTALEGHRYSSAKTMKQKTEAKRRAKRALAIRVGGFLVLLVIGMISYQIFRSWSEMSNLPPQSFESDLTQPSSDVRIEALESKSSPEDVEKVGQEQLPEQTALDKDSEEAKRIEVGRKEKYADKFRKMRDDFQGASVSYWSKLTKDKRPGRMMGEWPLLVSAESGGVDIYVLASDTNGNFCAELIDEDGNANRLDSEETVRLLKEKGGYLYSDGMAYMISPSDSYKRFQVPQSASGKFNPSEAVFANLYQIASRMKVEKLRFDVYFTVNEKTEPIKIGTVSFGETVGYEAFAKTVSSYAQSLRSKQANLDLKVKKIRKTVVFYDGAHISRGLGGVTKIPRKRPDNRNYREWLEWPELYDQALRQEYAQKRAEEDAKRARREWTEKINGPATRDEIQKVLSAGFVTVKCL